MVSKMHSFSVMIHDDFSVFFVFYFLLAPRRYVYRTDFDVGMRTVEFLFSDAIYRLSNYFI